MVQHISIETSKLNKAYRLRNAHNEAFLFYFQPFRNGRLFSTIKVILTISIIDTVKLDGLEIGTKYQLVGWQMIKDKNAELVKGAESTTLALDKLGACWYHVISKNKQLIKYQKKETR